MTESRHLPDALGHAPADKRLEVLRQVGLTGSISQAARHVGISYKAAWQAIDTLTSLSGQALVEKTVGGVGGGGALLTPQGQQLLALADALAAARAEVLARHGHVPEAALRLGLRTSMRNQLACRVLELIGAPTALVLQIRLQLPDLQTLDATITRESADLLGLSVGRPVLALCKATAVKVQAIDPVRRLSGESGGCCLSGQVHRVTAGDALDEVSLQLPGGGQWVGYTRHGELAPGQAVEARFPSSAVVVAWPD